MRVREGVGVELRVGVDREDAEPNLSPFPEDSTDDGAPGLWSGAAPSLILAGIVVRIELIFSSSCSSEDLTGLGFVFEFTGVTGEKLGVVKVGVVGPGLLLRCLNKPEDLESGRLERRLLDLRGMIGDIGDTGDVGDCDCVGFWRLSKTRSNGDCSSAEESLRTLRFSEELLGRRNREGSSSSIMLPPLVSEYWLKFEVE